MKDKNELLGGDLRLFQLQNVPVPKNSDNHKYLVGCSSILVQKGLK